MIGFLGRIFGKLGGAAHAGAPGTSTPPSTSYTYFYVAGQY